MMPSLVESLSQWFYLDPITELTRLNHPGLGCVHTCTGREPESTVHLYRSRTRLYRTPVLVANQTLPYTCTGCEPDSTVHLYRSRTRLYRTPVPVANQTLPYTCTGCEPDSTVHLYRSRTRLYRTPVPVANQTLPYTCTGREPDSTVYLYRSRTRIYRTPVPTRTRLYRTPVPVANQTLPYTCTGREPDSTVPSARVRFASTRGKNWPATNRSRPVKLQRRVHTATGTRNGTDMLFYLWVTSVGRQLITIALLIACNIQRMMVLFCTK